VNEHPGAGARRGRQSLEGRSAQTSRDEVARHGVEEAVAVIAVDGASHDRSKSCNVYFMNLGGGSWCWSTW
jgi:hypothetical protein